MHDLLPHAHRPPWSPRLSLEDHNSSVLQPRVTKGVKNVERLSFDQGKGPQTHLKWQLLGGRPTGGPACSTGVPHTTRAPRSSTRKSDRGRRSASSRSSRPCSATRAPPPCQTRRGLSHAQAQQGQAQGREGGDGAGCWPQLVMPRRIAKRGHVSTRHSLRASSFGNPANKREDNGLIAWPRTHIFR
jgi:hypothetical protein